MPTSVSFNPATMNPAAIVLPTKSNDYFENIIIILLLMIIFFMIFKKYIN